MPVVIVGGGICGLTLALALDQRGIDCHVYEAAPDIKPLGVGISLLAHGTKELMELGLRDAVQRVAVEFEESCFFTSHGQLILRDRASSQWPSFLIHRADLHEILLHAVYERLGPEKVSLNHTLVSVHQTDDSAVAHFTPTVGDGGGHSAPGEAVIGCDGIHSAVRSEFYPDEGPPVFSGINMWRGVSPHHPILSGGTHVRAGTLDTGKLVLYPIRKNIDDEGRQLLNWVVEVREANAAPAEWSAPGRLDEFAQLFDDWRFDWIDVPELLKGAQVILKYPMTDRDPLPRWTFDRVTLAGDAAHPMLPRGSNGAMQAILDARVIADALAAEETTAALRHYEKLRLPVANAVVLRNRVTPPDALIQMVEDRTGGKPFDRIEDVITEHELRSVLYDYKHLAGYSEDKLLAAARKK